MAALGRLAFLAAAVVFHLVYIYSIFDIYFVSPIVSGMQPVSVDRPANQKSPADRLVLFVGDGLRADKAFQAFPEPYPESDADLVPRHLAPFIRSRVLHHGTFGVSHTRVPTESRPGHVAMIAGLYEDVSAVATGWKLNPVNFDSVFNRSRHTWSWGSPDILPMFERGAVPGRVDAFTYAADFEDFSKDATHLDIWVFDHVKDLFTQAATNRTLNRALREDKVVFFLHLLGIDTTGHGFRPFSKEYLRNIQIVDKGVQEVTDLIQKFYGDDRTAFVFTADHGMSDWGSHGDGHPDNTRTPLVCWGSGVAPPLLHPGKIAPGHDELSADWGLDHVQRHDVAQADIAALMAWLIGAEFPVNSVGKLPLPYMAANIRERARGLLANAREILEMYRVKEEKKQANEMRYKPYGAFAVAGLTPAERVAHIEELIARGKYEEAIEESDALINLTLEGLRYLQTYDWLFLRALITVGYLGWIAYAITTVINLYVVPVPTAPKRNISTVLGFSSALAVLYASFIASKSPPTYYAYAFFPVVFWEEVFAQRGNLREGGRLLFAHIGSAGQIAAFIANAIIYCAIIISLALGYIHREILTGLFILGAIWPATCGMSFVRSNALLSAAWAISCLIMSTFTLLPAMKLENVDLIVGSGVIMSLVGLLYMIFEPFVLSDFSSVGAEFNKHTNSLLSRVATGIQVGLIILATVVTRSSALSIQAKRGLPLGNQVTGWAVLIASFLTPLLHRLSPNSNFMHRLAMMFFTCAPTFIILTISYEGLFYVAFSLLLLIWVRLEHRLETFGASQNSSANGSAKTDKTISYRPLRLSDARVALFFMVLLQSAFFSTGNVASVSSFSLESVNRLIPVFDPFSQGALLVLKIMIPFVLISANLGILNTRLQVAPSAFFMVVMAVSDILTLYFFWVVKDEGSWLEIGSTISHFVIASLMCVFVALLEGVSALFISGIDVGVASHPGLNSKVNGTKDRKEVQK
ncbi:PigN-domain-containing protein [Trichoderma citrinoviride]|uniref:GPI ethanolamine phosphate transferase 1 n=1 Tax=Trichoderma citrinoviride TaxID=58853 RepID=A0A2T4BNZ1_9HYPO|nr:PigN-domain-containing protein [Trichoderma citrinoviride]PTB71034.1 PigN-domain-containing protein [Trichoderma citrinoviride]